MNNALAIVAFALSFVVFSAKGGGEFAEDGFVSGTSFDGRGTGVFSTECDDSGGTSGDLYWMPLSTNATSVVRYGTGEAYDYAAHGLVRNPFLVESEGADNTNRLSVVSDLALERLIAPRHDAGWDVPPAASNVLVKTAKYDGIYADLLTKFTPSVSEPTLDDSDRIVIWLRESGSGDGNTVTNLMVTAGQYGGSLSTVTPVSYVVESPKISVGEWYRLTVRTVSDVTDGVKCQGFTVYIDGEPVTAESSGYSVFSGGEKTELLTAAARVLIRERRLFPSIASAGSNGAMTLSGMAFTGTGGADDIVFTTERPDYVVDENVFTLSWDRGVTHLSCSVSNDFGLVESREVDASAFPNGFTDFGIGTNVPVRVYVTATHDEASGYSNGVWTATGCTLSDGVYTFGGGVSNPSGCVQSSRDVIGVGGVAGGCTTFAEALKLARDSGKAGKTIVLMEDVTISTAKQGAYNDGGAFIVSKGDDVTLDLMGHTLRGSSAWYPTISLGGGKLRIMDSVGGGAVVPYVSAKGVTNAVAVKAWGTASAVPTIAIEGGRYDGQVVVSGQVVQVLGDASYQAKCVIGGGQFKCDALESFYLESYITNEWVYFAPTEPGYWGARTNGYIWCGEAWPDARWSTAKNWRCGKVPGAGDLALFPRTGRGAAGGWDVDFGYGVATKDLWVDADVIMTGENEFGDVTVVSGTNRFVGTGTMTFTGSDAVPGMLTSSAAGNGEVRLGAAWRGTVRIGSVTSPKVLRNIAGWGVAGSKVEFCGVQGYLSDRASYELPYELVLTDNGDSPAWRNDTGYTGSTVSFPKLSGSGTFYSPANKKAVLQVFNFKDVSTFTGTFRMGGKRLVLGTGSAAAASGAGDVTFSDEVRVQANHGWSGVNAFFGQSLEVVGSLGDSILRYSGSAKSATNAVESVSEVRLYATATDSEYITCKLAVDGKDIVVSAGSAVTVSGKLLSPEAATASVASGSSLDIPVGSDVSIVGNDIVVNGSVVSSVADYYDVVPKSGEGTSFSVVFNDSAAPSLAEFAMESGDGEVRISVNNVRAGLWYGLQKTSTLAGEWSAPNEWVRAAEDGEALVLSTPQSGETGFYRVVVTDENPYGSAQ